MLLPLSVFADTKKFEPYYTCFLLLQVLDKGPPDDAWPGIEGRQVPLRDDQNYIPGLLNSQGVKVRFTFKDEQQQVWIGAATHTQKVPYSSITKIEAQGIEGNEKYSILRVQLGAAGEINKRLQASHWSGGSFCYRG